MLERRLSDSSQRLKRLRSDLAVADEQLAALADTVEETRLRALVSETTGAKREFRQAQRHADAMARHRTELIEAIANIQRIQDQLLDQMTADPG